MPKQERYSEFIHGTEDLKTQSGPIFRHALAMNELKTGLENGEKSVYEGFLRGSKLTKTGNCMGYRPKVGDTYGDYEWFSYAQIGEMIDKLSSAMMRLNLCPETKGSQLHVSDGSDARLVGIFARTRYEWAVAEYACYRCNAVVVTLYDSLGVDAISYILDLTEVATLFCGCEDEVKSILSIIGRNGNSKLNTLITFDAVSEESQQEMQQAGIQYYSFSALIEQNTELMAPRFPQPEDICTICFTSGTTGKPKGVIVSHQCLLSLTLSINQHYKVAFHPGDVIIAYLPLAHMFERFVECNALYNGAAIGYWHGKVPELTNDLQKLRPTAFCAVPRIMQRIYGALKAKMSEVTGVSKWLLERALAVKQNNLAYDTCSHRVYDYFVFKPIARKVGLDRCRWILTGSAPVADEIVNFFKCVFCCAVLNGYGMTETAGGTCCSSSYDYSSVGHCGGPVSGIEGKLVSVPEKGYLFTDSIHYRNAEDKQGVEVFGRGELCFRGPGVFSGYYKNPEATHACMDEEGWFHSGDIGFVNKYNGSIELIDRIKNIFKLSQGEYIAVEKIENVYLQNKVVDQMFVYGNSQENFVIGVVVPNKEELLRCMREKGMSCAEPYAELCQKKEVRMLVLETLNATAVRANLFGFERIRNLYLENEEWSVANNVLSPSLKLKRFVTQQMYDVAIKNMYHEGQLI